MAKRILSDYRRKYLHYAVTLTRRKLKVRAIEYKGGACTRCGFKGCPAAFDFHHPDPQAKEFTVTGHYKSFDRIKPELDKTVLLCANCHRTVHEEQFVETLARKKAELQAEAAATPKTRGPKRRGPERKEEVSIPEPLRAHTV